MQYDKVYLIKAIKQVQILNCACCPQMSKNSTVTLLSGNIFEHNVLLLYLLTTATATSLLAKKQH